MKYLVNFLLLFLIFPTAFVFSQSKAAGNNENDVVKWEVLYGKDNEFALYMPQGYKSLSDGNYMVGSLGISFRVDKKLTVHRYINGVVLMMEYFEGDAKGIMKDSLKSDKKSSDEIKEINGFDFFQTITEENNTYDKKQYYRIKNRLYVVRAISKTANNEIAENFFKALTLINDKKGVSPNISDDVKSISLANIIEQKTVKVENVEPIDSKEADRGIIILQLSAPKFDSSDLRNASELKIKLKIFYSPSGEVSDVEVLESSSKSFEKAAVEAAKKTVFLPAEKDGKFIPVYQTQEFEFTKSSRIFIL